VGLLACATAPTPPLDDLTGQWSLALSHAVPGGPSCHLEGVALTLVSTPQGPAVVYRADIAGGSGACSSQGQTTSVEMRPARADSVVYSHGDLRMVFGLQTFVGVSVGSRLVGRYTSDLGNPPYSKTGSWSATLGQ
jgi:hypothetical protein